MADIIRVDLPWDSQPQEIPESVSEWFDWVWLPFSTAPQSIGPLALPLSPTGAPPLGVGAQGRTWELNGSSQYLAASQSLILEPPFTLMVVARTPDVSLNSFALTLADPASDPNSFGIRFNAGAAAAYTFGAAGFTQSTHGTAPVNNRWHVLGGVFESIASRQVWLDGTPGPAETTSNVVTGIANVSVGVLLRSSIVGYFTGQIAGAFVSRKAVPAGVMAELGRAPWSQFGRSVWVPVSAGGGGSTGPVGLATETDAAQVLAGKQVRALGLATETDAAQTLAGKQIRALGRADETDAALALTGKQLRAVGLSTEVDTALALSSTAGAQVGMASESDAAFALAAVQKLLTGAAQEVDTALTLSAGTGYTDLELILKILRNRQELNAATGMFTLYDDDSVSVLFTANAWADAAGTVPYSGGTLGRIDALA